MKIGTRVIAAAFTAAAGLVGAGAPGWAQEGNGPSLVLEASSPPAREALWRNAETYAAYHEDVDAAGERELRSGQDLDATMDSLAQYYDEDRLSNAQVAYTALVASQHAQFIDSIRAVADYYGMDTALQGFLNDPAYAIGFQGADAASDTVMGAIAEDVGSIRTVGGRYRQAAYDLQAQAWAQTRARDRDTRLRALETAADRLSVNFSLADQATEREMGSAAALFAEATGRQRPQLDLSVHVGEEQMTPDERRVGRILAVAALQSIESGDMGALNALLADPGVERCVNWARLHLAQCVAAGHFKYEDSFCIAEHALNDIAQCLSATRAAPSAGALTAQASPSN